MGAGRSVCPISHSSTPAAQERPSAIAHTMRLCPRPMSPHANTPSSVVWNDESRATLPRSSRLDPELFDHACPLGADEAQREQHQLARQLEVGAVDLLELAVAPLHLVGAQRAHVAVVIGEEALGVHAVDALAALLVGRRDAEHVGPGRPGIGRCPRVRRSVQDLELVDRRRALAVGGAEAVGTGVSAADDHHVLALSGDGRRVEVALLHTVPDRQVLHRLVDATVLAAGDREVAPRGCAAGEHDGVELGAQPIDGNVDPDVHTGAELGAFTAHLLDPPFEVALLHLELGDAVAQQAADPIRSLEHDDVVAGAGELLRGRETRGTGADHDDPLAGAHRRRLRRDPALVPRTVDDLDLDLLDGDGIGVDPQHARGLARGGAQPAGELGEVVGRVQALDRVAPVLAVDEVVPVGNEVAERASVVAEGDTAVHAPAGLGLELVAREGLVDLPPVAQAHGDGATRRRLASPLEEPGGLTHAPTP